MPELPEVETTVRGLNKKVLKRTFVDVWSDCYKISWKEKIKGRKILKIWRRAKNIILDLSDGYSLLVHLKMTGHLLVGKWEQAEEKWKPIKEGPLNDPYNRFLHIIFFLDNKEMLALSDARKFAKLELWKTSDLLNSSDLQNLGPEPLDKSFTLEKFKKVFKNKKGKIKQVLMDPKVIAGIGNIYASEILWQVRIHPQTNIVNLKEKELKLLYKTIINVLNLGIKLGGDSFSDYRKVDGSKGNFHAERKVYNREGEKCKRCGTKIKRIKIGGRSSFFCPHCQPFD